MNQTIPLPKAITELVTKFRFRYYLPQVQHANLEGVDLDIGSLSPMMKNIILTGRYESQERKFCASVLGPEDTVLELGSAIGFIGLYCRKVLRVKHVTGVEANPNTLTMLNKNYLANGVTPDVIHAAAAADDGEIELDVAGEFWENTVAGQRDDASMLKVPALSFDSLLQRMPQKPTALVCDIEGAEAYLDFTKLPKSVKSIIIELHPDITGKEKIESIIHTLNDLGFTVTNSEEDCYLLIKK